MNKFLRLPLVYEKQDFNDDRFVKVRVKVMHNGLNLNGSSFSDAAIEKAAATLKNIPLLAFVKKTDGVDDADFAGHEFEYRWDEDGIKYTYLGRPIGMIPETNNYTYEEDENGIKFVYADGYIWTDYANEALEIMQRDGSKSVSMEIRVNSYSDNESVLEITDYKYTGIAVLGDDVPPAMMGAKVDIANFSAEGLGEFVANFSATLQEALEPNPEEPIEPEFTSDPEPEVVEPEVVEPEVVEPEVVEPESSPEPEVTVEVDFEKELAEIQMEAASLKKELEEIKTELEFRKAELLKAQEEKVELEQFKARVEKEEFSMKVKELIVDFSDLEETEINGIISNSTNLEEIELKLFAARGKKASIKAPAQKIQTYGVWDSQIRQDKETNEPVWASLVKKYSETK